MPKRSAGLLLFRRSGSAIEVLLAHPGGPFWARKDHGVWSIPKGEYADDEDSLTAARREFTEETGCDPPDGPTIALGEVVQSRTKTVTAYAVEADFDPASLRGETIEIEWPPRSGKRITIPEIDRVDWFAMDEARTRILPGQAPFLERLIAVLSRGPAPPAAPRPER